MRFITEDDLRKQYKDMPVDTYSPQPGTKLTPGARQFLADRQIRIWGQDFSSRPVIRESLKREICCPSANPGHNRQNTVERCPWRQKIAAEKLEIVGGMFRRAEICFESGGRLEAQRMRALRAQYDEFLAESNRCGVQCRLSCGECKGQACRTEPEKEYICCPGNAGWELCSLRELNVAVCSLKTILLLACGEDGTFQSCANLLSRLDEIRHSLIRLIRDLEAAYGC